MRRILSGLLLILFLAPSLAGTGFEGPRTGNFLLQYHPASENRIQNFSVVSGKQFISQQATADSVNARLQEIYLRYGIECYFVLMEYFDVKVEADATGKTGPDSLFGGGKFYSENSIIDSLMLFQRKVGKWMRSTLADSVQRPIILVNVARYHTVFTGTQGANYYLSLHYAHRGNNLSLPTGFNATYTDFLERCQFHNLFGAHLFNDNLVIAYANLFRDAAIKTDLQSRILSTYTVSGLKDILKYFTPGDIDYKRLSLAERLHALSLLVGEPMMGGVGIVPGEEEFALWLVKYCPSAELPAFFSALALESVLNNNPYYGGDKGNVSPLMERLIAGIDGDNYTKLIRHTTELLRKSPGYEQQVISLFTEQEIAKRNFIWNDSWTQVPVVGHVKYHTQFGQGGKIEVITKRVDGVITSTSASGNVPVTSVTYADEPARQFNYFDPVLFTSDCDLPAFSEAGAETGVPMIVPAVFLKYAQDKEWNDHTLTAAAITGDLLTLATAPLALSKAVTWTRRAWLAFETATALGNLSINTLGSDLPPGFEEVVQQSNYLMLVVGGKNLLKGGYSSLQYALAGTKEFTTRISKELALNLARSLNAESAPGLTRLQKLEQLASTNPSAKAITRFYEKLKQLYRDSFKRDLETDLLPPPASYLPPWVSEIKTVEDYLKRLPDELINRTKEAFISGSIQLKFASEEIILIRHIKDGDNAKGAWYSEKIYSPSNARKYLALPFTNTADYIVKVRVKPGVPYLEGIVASQINNVDFGPYAVGGGKQSFFLKELYTNDALLQIIEGPIVNTSVP